MKKVWIVVMLFILAGPLFSQDSIAVRKTKKRPFKSYLIEDRPWSIEIPLWIPGFRGQFSYGDIVLDGGDGTDPGDPEDPDDDVEDGILSRLFSKDMNLHFVFFGKAAYENKGFLALVDGFGGGIGTSIKFNYNNKEVVQANVRVLNFRLLLGYRVWQVTSAKENFRYELYTYAGARTHFYKISSDLNRVINKLDINPKWVEPLIGVQNQFNFKRWQIALHGDIGGLMLNDKYSTMLQGTVNYRAGRVVSIKLGWTYLTMNHFGVLAGEDVKLKVTLTGPSAGLTFHF